MDHHAREQFPFFLYSHQNGPRCQNYFSNPGQEQCRDPGTRACKCGGSGAQVGEKVSCKDAKRMTAPN